MTSDAILSELRTLPGAPESLRERVRALPEPKPRFSWAVPRIDVRRTLLIAAPAVLALGFGAAALHGLVDGTSTGSRSVALEPAVTHGHSGAGSSAITTTPVFSAHDRRAIGANGFAAAPEAKDATTLPPSTTRLNKYNAWLRLRVSDDRLARSTTRAMQIARGYGGYVASVDMNTPSRRGTAFLVLRVPVTKVEDAVLRLGKLGDVAAQRVRIQDLTRQANTLNRDILRLRTTIVGLERKLRGKLTAEERLRVQYQLAEAKQQLAQKTKARSATVREGTLATVSLSFFTPKAAAA